MDTIFQQQISASHTRWSLVRYSGCHIRSPTGTVLGPLLFLCFIKDLPESILSSDTKLFADDSLLFKVIENDNDRELLRETFQRWNSVKKLGRRNLTKCVVLRISNKKKPTRKTDYQLHGHILEEVDASKYLGVTLQKIYHGTSTSRTQ